MTIIDDAVRTILVQLHLTCCIRHAVQIVTTEEYMEQIPLLIPKYYNLHTNVEYTHAALSGPTGRKAYINTEKNLWPGWKPIVR